MAEENDITQKKTLRLKKPGGTDEGTTQATVAPMGMVTAGMGKPQAAPATGKSNTGAAIMALVATLIFAALVLIQVMELQAYKYAFPRPQIQAMP